MTHVTIADFPIDRSNRYAKDREQYDPALIKEGHAVALQAGIDVTTSGFTSSFDILFGLRDARKTYALFNPPAKTRPIFLSNALMTSSMGNRERREAQKGRMQSYQPTTSTPVATSSETMSWEAEREIQQQTKEKDALLGLFDTVERIERNSVDLNSARNEYYKA